MASRTELIDYITVVPYGVLGTQLTADRKIAAITTVDEGPTTVIVDPAGLHHIQGLPEGAGGAAGAIYSWIGKEALPLDQPFPRYVSRKLTCPTQAVKFAYDSGRKFVIHAVGPDLRTEAYTKLEGEDARCKVVRDLSSTYVSVLHEFALHMSPELQSWRHDVHDHNLYQPWATLRLLPVSSGIFSGKFKDEMPELTARALSAAFSSLPQDERRSLAMRTKDIELCIFDETEFVSYKTALALQRNEIKGTMDLMEHAVADSTQHKQDQYRIREEIHK